MIEWIPERIRRLHRQQPPLDMGEEQPPKDVAEAYERAHRQTEGTETRNRIFPLQPAFGETWTQREKRRRRRNGS